MVLGIKILGFLFSRLDTSLLEQIVSLLAKIFFVFPSRRKETLISNLRYAFPEWSEPKIDGIARVSVARMLEMGFFFRSPILLCQKVGGGVQSCTLKIPKKN